MKKFLIIAFISLFLISSVFINCSEKKDRIVISKKDELTNTISNEEKKDKIIIKDNIEATKNVEVNIDWVMSYKDGMKKAIAENKNAFVLITAPSWCGWCIKLENETLIVKEVQDYIKKEFIPIKLLDVIDGKKNEELKEIKFSGFPSIVFVSKEGKNIGKVGGFVPAEYLLEEMKKYSTTGYNEFLKKVEKDFEVSKKDGDFAVKYLNQLLERDELELCRDKAMELFNTSKLDKMYKEQFLFTAYLCSLYKEDFNNGIKTSELYEKTFPDGKNIEYVKYLRIIALFYIEDLKKAKSETEKFKELYPESQYLGNLNEMLEKSNTKSDF